MRFASTYLAAVSILALAMSSAVEARSPKKRPQRPPNVHHGMFGSSAPVVPTFEITRALPARARAGAKSHSGASGSKLIGHGDRLFVLDADSGELVLANLKGEVLSRLSMGLNPTQMVMDPAGKRLWVAVRGEHRVVAVAFDDAKGQPFLRRVNAFSTPDPHGLALTPDGKRLAVSSPAEGRVSLWNTHTIERSWSRELGPEPRGLAIDPSGSELAVSFLTMGAVATVDLNSQHPRVEYRALDPEADPASTVGLGGLGGFQGVGNGSGFEQRAAPQAKQVNTDGPVVVSEGRTRGESFARNAFALAYLGPDLLVVPHQLSTPVAAEIGSVSRGSYGGGGAANMAVRHRLSFVEGEGQAIGHARIALHQPRAMAYDAGSDRLYVVGYGNDKLLAVDQVTQSSAHLAYELPLAGAPDLGLGACGPDAIVLTQAGPVVRCEFDRGLRFVEEGNTGTRERAKVTRASASLSESRRTESVARGAEIFRRGDDISVSANGAMACASCHPEGLTDGLSWRIEGRALQTPLLRGRVTGSHPYKWDGKDATLPDSLRNTVGRLGGRGLKPAEAKDLQNYLASLAAPRTPVTRRPEAVKRGARLFASDQLNCDSCHGGGDLRDGAMHQLDSDLPEADTPSLVGLARSAPYYHDGSAPSLTALLMDNGRVHGMVDASALPREQREDLIAYLVSL